MREGIIRGLSIGYKSIKETMAGSVRHLREIRLYEGSLVTFGANPEALVTAVKADETAADTDEAIAAFKNAARDTRDFYTRMIEGE